MKSTKPTLESGKQNRGTISMGAAFMSAMVTVGPALITQISNFTRDLGGSIFLAIVFAAVLIYFSEVSIWRMTAGSNQYFQDLSDRLLPGLGRLLSLLIVICSFIFNVGNVAGSSVGASSLTDLPERAGVLLGLLVSAVLFLSKNSLKIMNVVSQVFGAVFILVMLYTVLQYPVPFGKIFAASIRPDDAAGLFYPILSLVGTGLGGYAVFIGAHSLIDQGLGGAERLREISAFAGVGVGAGTLMRLLLFTAVFSVVSGASLASDGSNTLLSVFRVLLPGFGTQVYGLIMTVTSLSCIIFCTYATSGFVRSAFRLRDTDLRKIELGFLLSSGAAALVFGRPVRLLMIVGALTGLSIPLVLLIAILYVFRHPTMLGDSYPARRRIGVPLILCFLLISAIALGSLPELAEMIAA